MVPGCLIFSILASRFGLKKVLIIGTLGYAPYAASLYVNNRYGVEWFVLLGATLCGISASALWASEGAIAVGYPLVHERGYEKKHRDAVHLDRWHAFGCAMDSSGYYSNQPYAATQLTQFATIPLSYVAAQM
jgi:hypothetical protein